VTATITRPEPRQALDLPAAAGRPDHGDRLPRWAVAVAIAGLPLLVPHGPANTAPSDVFILAAIAATVLWAASTRQRVKFPYVIGVGTLVIAGSLAALFGDYPHEGAIAIAIDIFLLGWATAVANVGRTEGAAAFVVRAWCVTGSLWGVGLLAFFITHAASAGITTATSTRDAFIFGEQNGAGFYFAATVFVILAGRCPRRLWLRVPVVGCLLADMLLTGSLAALLGLLAGLLLAAVVAAARRGGGAAALLVLIVLGAATVVGYQQLNSYQLVEKAQSSQNPVLHNSIGRAQQSTWERQTLTQETLHLWSTSTLLGLGPDATKSTLEHDLAPYPKQAHDDWTAVLVERGVLGFAGLLLLVTELIVRARRVGGSGNQGGLPAPEFLVGALAALAVYSFTHEQLHDRTVWTLFGLLAAFSTWPGRAGWPAPRPGGRTP
jgi:O-antigen ligase/polysaccharide polymerase Wzy-like membrane protein